MQAKPARRHQRLVALASLGLAVCLLAGGGAWALLRCDRGAFAERSTASWLNLRERYLFACGQIWHSFDDGASWAQVPSQGLPSLARNGLIAVDRTPGRLYLGLLLAGRSTLRCLFCAWSEVTPAIFLSQDGGQHWDLAYRFTSGPVGDSLFRAVHADPNYSGSAWVVLTRGSETAYYATNTAGRAWIKTCVETYTGECDPPDQFLSRYESGRDSAP
jgi:photosystem II stability/assembly factor-like uncharacterized protein